MTVTMHRRRAATGMAALVAVALLLAGCSGGDDSSARSDGSEDMVEDAAGVTALQPAEGGPVAAEGSPGDAAGGDAPRGDGGAGGLDTPVLADRSVVYTVDLVVETDDVRAARDSAQAIAERFGGYVQSEGTYGVPRAPMPVEPGSSSGGSAEGPALSGDVSTFPSADEQATLVLRVPAERHEQAVAALEALGQTVSRNRDAQDVTDEVVDVATRIETQQASIDRLQTLLGEATKIGDILAIETELTSRIAELESLKARQEQLSSLTQLASVTVSFVPPETVVEEGSGFVAGLRAGWTAFVRAVEVGLTALGAALPFLVALAVVAVPLVGWLTWRHRRQRTRLAATQSGSPASGAPDSGPPESPTAQS